MYLLHPNSGSTKYYQCWSTTSSQCRAAASCPASYGVTASGAGKLTGCTGERFSIWTARADYHPIRAGDKVFLKQEALDRWMHAGVSRAQAVCPESASSRASSATSSNGGPCTGETLQIFSDKDNGSYLTKGDKVFFKYVNNGKWYYCPSNDGGCSAIATCPDDASMRKASTGSAGCYGELFYIYNIHNKLDNLI